MYYCYFSIAADIQSRSVELKSHAIDQKLFYNYGFFIRFDTYCSVQYGGNSTHPFSPSLATCLSDRKERFLYIKRLKGYWPYQVLATICIINLRFMKNYVHYLYPDRWAGTRRQIAKRAAMTSLVSLHRSEAVPLEVMSLVFGRESIRQLRVGYRGKWTI